MALVWLLSLHRNHSLYTSYLQAPPWRRRALAQTSLLGLPSTATPIAASFLFRHGTRVQLVDTLRFSKDAGVNINR